MFCLPMEISNLGRTLQFFFLQIISRCESWLFLNYNKKQIKVHLQQHTKCLEEQFFPLFVGNGMLVAAANCLHLSSELSRFQKFSITLSQFVLFIHLFFIWGWVADRLSSLQLLLGKSWGVPRSAKRQFPQCFLRLPWDLAWWYMLWSILKASKPDAWSRSWWYWSASAGSSQCGGAVALL